MTNAIPSPVYTGNAVTTGVTFSNPVFGQAPSEWPPVDPTVVTLTWIKGDGTETTWTYGVDMEIVKDGTGVYHAELPNDVSGRWRVKWVGTGACAAVWVAGYPVTDPPF